MSKSKIIGYDYEKESFLSKPEYGWVEFKPGNKVYNISYWINNLPHDWLDAAIEGIKNGNHFFVGGHQESDGPVFCVVPHVPFEDYCYVIAPGMDDKIEEFKCSREEFCEVLCNDLEKNIDEWAEWSAQVCGKLAVVLSDTDKEHNEEVLQREKRKILNKIEELRILLEEHHETIYFNPNYKQNKFGFGGEDN